jgi:hypothetical protein
VHFRGRSKIEKEILTEEIFDKIAIAILRGTQLRQKSR